MTGASLECRNETNRADRSGAIDGGYGWRRRPSGGSCGRLGTLPGPIGNRKRNGRLSACWLAVIALNLFAVWLNVRLNHWNNAFYNALQQYNWGEFWRQFGIFGMMAFALIVDAVYSLYLRQILHIRWRRWLTEHFLHDWLDDQQYYRMQLNQTVDRQPGSAHLRRSRQLRDDEPRLVARPAEFLCHPGLVSVDPVGAVGRADDPARRRGELSASPATWSLPR